MSTNTVIFGNPLADSDSSYLRSAADQPVYWYPWGDDAFAAARKSNRPILLDIGASWCHWCHVMDRESYENDEIAELINGLYVPIKVDRDERPDIDARYQQAVQAVTGQGGWPLTCFLTPDGNLFWGGTYFPPTDTHGRPGFRRVLREVSAFYAERGDDARKQGLTIREALERAALTASPDCLVTGEHVEPIIRNIHRSYDSKHGGFGTSPKFPHPSVIDLLLARYAAHGEQTDLDVALHTLRAMAGGGVHDQLGGGFHRYSVDEKWIVPHFEKMLYDNAGLLSNYARAFAISGDDEMRNAALNIIDFTNRVLSDRQLGGFYASQDADIGMEDDGDYWTWTIGEARDELTPDEFAVMQLRFDIYEEGEMHLDPMRNVLFIAHDIPEIAALTTRSEPEVRSLVESGIAKLLNARSRRATPFVDTSIYAAWNGMMIRAYFDAARFLDLPDAREFALKSLDRILNDGTTPSGMVSHRVDAKTRAPGSLDDHVQIGLACLDAWFATSEAHWFDEAVRLATILLENYQTSSGGFNDTPSGSDGTGLLAATVKPIQDSPTESGNACAIQFFDLLWRITGDTSYEAATNEAAGVFADMTESLGLFVSALGLGIEFLVNPPPVAVITGDPLPPTVIEVRDRLLSLPRAGTAIIVSDPSSRDQTHLPPTIPTDGSQITSNLPTIHVCTGTTCSAPTTDVDEAVRLILGN
jgi:uncharacterized protein